MKKLNIIAECCGDDFLLPFRSYTLYKTEEEALAVARPPYHTPINLKMLIHLLEVEDESEVWAYKPSYVCHNEDGCYIPGGDWHEDTPWSWQSGPWRLSYTNTGDAVRLTEIDFEK